MHINAPSTHYVLDLVQYLVTNFSVFRCVIGGLELTPAAAREVVALLRHEEQSRLRGGMD